MSRPGLTAGLVPNVPFARRVRSEVSDTLAVVTGVNDVVLVEGESDQAALQSLARHLGRDLEAEGVSIIAMGGASLLGQFLGEVAGSDLFEVRVAGLCDEGEVGDFRRGLEQAGFDTDLSRSDMEALGFYVCVRDLEDELIHSLGTGVVQEVIENQGELGSFRTFQNQPQWRGRRVEDQLRRFIGVKAGRKVRYGRLLVEALDLTRAPRPLVGVLAHV